MEREQRIMEMNGIQGGRIPEQTPQVPPVRDQRAAPKAPDSKPDADKIEFSEEARKNAADPSQTSRDSIVESARQKLDSGALATPEAMEKAAENLLRSGDLKNGGE